MSEIVQDRFIDNRSISRVVKGWMILGLVMILFQVMLGGITRLTGSGLSITKWDIVVGSVPPLNSSQWEKEFDLYKETPQYKKINQGMNLSEFKFIYFWEFVHRLWGRSMGLIFLFPFIYFWRKRMLSKSLFKDLIVVFLLASLVASFGWIMVASGLIERPWVNAYKLTLHLSLAIICFSYLLWSTFKVIQPDIKVFHNPLLKRFGIIFSLLVFIQIIFGGVMAGIKAGAFYPTWPDMNGNIVPQLIFETANWSVENFVNYEGSSFLPALIQTLHRSLAYLLIISGLYYFFLSFKHNKNQGFKTGIVVLISLLGIQVLLGILTVINCLGSVPLFFGVMHQFFAVLLFSASLYLNFLSLKVSQ